jgi:hypothetical protein
MRLSVRVRTDRLHDRPDAAAGQDNMMFRLRRKRICEGEVAGESRVEFQPDFRKNLRIMKTK